MEPNKKLKLGELKTYQTISGKTIYKGEVNMNPTMEDKAYIVLYPEKDGSLTIYQDEFEFDHFM